MTTFEGPSVWAVVVGTGSHDPDGQLPSVPQATASAREIGECLTDVCGLDPERLTVIKDPEGPGYLEAVIQNCSSRADGLFLFYYIGHGLLDEKNLLHLATKKTKSLTLPYGDSLPYERVASALQDHAYGRGRDTIVVLDCCYSAVALRADRAPAQAAFGQINVAGAYELCASAEGTQAWYSADAEYTTFSGAFADLLRNGDARLPPALRLNDLAAVLEERMRLAGAPIPRFRDEDLIGGRIVLASNAAYQPPGPPQARPEKEARIPGDVSPYRDLRAYDVADHELFFGRHTLVAGFLHDLGHRVSQGGVHLIAGPSGSGKSSILRAGVLYRIGQGNLDIEGSARWPQVLITPGSDPLLPLAQWLGYSDAGARAQVPTLRDRLLRDPDSFGAQIARRPPVVPGRDGCRVIIAVDQLEQVFAPDIGEDVRAAFLRALQSAAASRDGDFPAALVIAGLRSDFLGVYQEYGRPAGQATEVILSVRPMDRDELREVIEGPARMGGLAFDRGLVDALLRDVDEHTSVGPSPVRGRSVLPHLSHALQGTWNERKEVTESPRGGPERIWYALTLDGYQRTGGIPRALSSTADQALSSLSAESRPAAAKLLLSLVRRVSMGDSVVETGRSARRAELETLAEPAVVTQVLNAFIERRLLTADADEIAFAHEAVITSWDTLRNWIAAAGEWLDVQREVDEAANQWAGKATAATAPAGQPRRIAKAVRDLLLPDSRLEDVLRRIGRSGHVPADLKPVSRDFIVASQRARTRRGRMRRVYVSALAVLTVISLAAALVASVNAQRTQTARTEADSRAAAAEAAQQRAIDPNTSAQLAVAAYRISPTVEARSALLSTASLTPVTRLADHVSPRQGGTLAIAATRDSRTLATAGADGTVNLRDVSDPRHPGLLSHFAVTPAPTEEPVVAAAFSPNGALLATGDDYGRLRLWDVRNPRAPHPLGQALADPGGAVDTLAFRSSAVLATGSRDGIVQLWNVGDYTPAVLGQPIKGFVGALTSLVFSPDGQTLAVCDRSGTTIALFNTTDPAHPKPGARLGGHSGVVRALAFSHNGRTLASAAEDNAVHLWKITGSAAVASDGPPLTGHTDLIYAIAFSPDDTLLATGGNDDTVRVWDLASGRSIAVLAHPQPVQGVLFADRDSVVITAGNDGLLRSWQMANRQLIGPTGQVASVVHSPHGDTLAEGDSNGQLWMWDVTHSDHPVLDGSPHGVCLGQRSGIQRMAFNPKGNILAVPCNGGHIVLLNVTNPSHPVLAGPPLTGDTNDVDAVAFADKGQVLASGSNDGTTRLWDVTNPGHAHQIGPPLTEGNGAIFDVAVSPNGTVLAAGGGNSAAQLWDVSRPAEPRKLGLPLGGHSEPVLGLAFQPRGDLLAVAGEDGTVQLWNVTNRQHPVDDSPPLVNTGGAITDVAFGPGGLLAMTNADSTVWLWRVDSPRHTTLLARLSGHNQAAFFADFSPDGSTLATASIDSTAFLWDTDPGHTAAAVCAVIGEPLTNAESARFLPDDKHQRICP